MALGLSESEEKILRHVDEGRTTMLLRELVRIPSPNPPGETRAVADFLTRHLEKEGIRTLCVQKEDAQVNVIGKVKGRGGGKSLCLNAHLDTVPTGDLSKWKRQPLEGELGDRKIYGRGTTDCKGGVAAIIAAAEAIVRAGISLKGDITLVLVAGEETLSDAGTAYLLKEGLIDADGVIVAEPTTLPSEDGRRPPLQIFTASRGMSLFEIAVEGRSVHAKAAPSGINAIEKMAKIVLALQSCNFRNGLAHPLCGKPTFNVGLIEGGTTPNMVPDSCRITLNRNTVPGENEETAYREISGLLNNLREKDEDLKVTLKPLFNADPSETSESAEIVEVLKGAVESLTGVTPGVGGMIGANDSRFFIEKGMPTVICGPGITTQSHAVDEYVEIEAVVNAARVYALTLIRFCQ
jgi:acetylornithine deacetylase/succinyl-diaminopimelate desuccinylase family protein